MIEYNLTEPNGRVNDLIQLVQKLPGNEKVKISRDYKYNGTPLWSLGWNIKKFPSIRRSLIKRLQLRGVINGKFIAKTVNS